MQADAEMMKALSKLDQRKMGHPDLHKITKSARLVARTAFPKLFSKNRKISTFIEK